MNRRDFLKVGIGGLAAAAALGRAPGVLHAAEQAQGAAVTDADALADRAVFHFMEGNRTCSEALLLAGAEALGVRSPLVPDIALGMAGGMGLLGKTCGAVTASIMVLSLAAGRKEKDEKKKRMLAFNTAASLQKRFAEKFKTTDCRKLCGLDLTTPKGRKALQERVRAETCRPIIAACAKMLAEELNGLS